MHLALVQGNARMHVKPINQSTNFANFHVRSWGMEGLQNAPKLALGILGGGLGLALLALPSPKWAQSVYNAALQFVLLVHEVNYGSIPVSNVNGTSNLHLTGVIKDGLNNMFTHCMTVLVWTINVRLWPSFSLFFRGLRYLLPCSFVCTSVIYLCLRAKVLPLPSSFSSSTFHLSLCVLVRFGSPFFRAFPWKSFFKD